LFIKTTNLYESDVAIIRSYGIKSKLTLIRTLRKKGYEIRKEFIKGTINQEKLDNSISRTRSKIFELSYCNPWELFITLTIDQKKYDRKDLNGYQKDLAHWLRNYNAKHHTNIKYLLIPEMHKDGSWHLHGFTMGIPPDHLKINEHGHLDWFPYRDKFGFCSMEKIRNHEAVSKYITKYISKDLADCVKDLNAHMYYCSKGLKRSEVMKKGTLAATNIPWDYENDYVKCVWFDDRAESILDLVLN